MAKQLSGGESSGTDNMDEMEDGGLDEGVDDIGDMPSQNEMKRELIIAIEEELKEQDELRR